MRVFIVIPKAMDLYEAQTCRDQFNAQVQDEPIEDIEVDLGQCEFIDSSGVAFVMWMYSKCHKIKLLNTPASIEKSFKVYGIWDFLCGS